MNTTDKGWETKLSGREPQVRAIAEYLGCNADELWKEIRGILEWEYASQETLAKEEYERGRKDAVEFIRRECWVSSVDHPAIKKKLEMDESTLDEALEAALETHQSTKSE